MVRLFFSIKPNVPLYITHPYFVCGVAAGEATCISNILFKFGTVGQQVKQIFQFISHESEEIMKSYQLKVNL